MVEAVSATTTPCADRPVDKLRRAAAGNLEAVCTGQEDSGLRYSVLLHRFLPRTTLAIVEISCRKITDHSPCEIRQSQSLTIRLTARPDADLRDVVQRLDAVAESLRRDLLEARRLATDSGLEVVAEKNGYRAMKPVATDTRPSTMAQLLAGGDPDDPVGGFRPVPGWPAYDVSRAGIVRCHLDREKQAIVDGPPRHLKPRWNELVGTFTVQLHRARNGTGDHRSETFAINALVAACLGS